MEDKFRCQSSELEATKASFQQSYDPYDGIIQVQIPRPTGCELDVVNMDMEQVMGSVLRSPVLVSACYLQRVETSAKQGMRSWRDGLEELREVHQRFSEERERLTVDSEAMETVEDTRNNFEETKKLNGKENSDDTVGRLELPQDLEKCHVKTEVDVLSSLHNYSTETCMRSFTTSLFVTGGGKEVTTKDVSNKWAKSFLSNIVATENECDYTSEMNCTKLSECGNVVKEESHLEKNNVFDGRNKKHSIFTTGKGEHMTVSNESLQHASMVLKEGLDEKVFTISKVGPKRKLTNSVLKRARKALYDNQTPQKKCESDSFTPENEFRIPLLRSYPDSVLPMKRTPSGITDSMLKRRNQVASSGYVSDSFIAKSASVRKAKKHISFHYTRYSLTGEPLNKTINVKKVSLKQLKERKFQNMYNTYSDDPELWSCVQDPVNFRFKNNRMNLDENFSLSPDISSSLKADCHLAIGLEEFKEHLRHLFPDADGPVTKVGTYSWIRNAYRLLVWKLASLELFFHPLLTNNLNARNLSIEFSKRLEREWNLGHRSILHKILERDALVGSHYIFFISDILDEDFIEVSDGWYCVRAKVDSFLHDAIIEKRLFKGCKISVCSARFHYFDEENPENTVLSLHLNGVRRARWNCKLGLRRYPPVLRSLTSIRAMGGQIPCIEVVIDRSFPVRFVEKESVDESKTRKVFRNEEDEERIALRRSEEVSVRLDEIFKREEQSTGQIPNPLVRLERDVSRMTEILVVDRRGKRRAYVTFWRPTDDALEILRNEGYVIRLYGVIPSRRLGDDETLHLAMPSKMPIQVLATEPPRDIFWIPRYSLSVSAIASLSVGEEFDSSFVVLLVGELQHSHTRFIYLMQTLQGAITAVKLFDEQAQSIPSVIKRATTSSKKISLVSVKNLKFMCCDKRCGIYICHHTSRCVWLSEHESKKTTQFIDQTTNLEKLVKEHHPTLMTWREQLLDFVNGKISNLYQLRGVKTARVWEMLNNSSLY